MINQNCGGICCASYAVRRGNASAWPCGRLPERGSESYAGVASVEETALVCASATAVASRVGRVNGRDAGAVVGIPTLNA